MNNNLSNLNTYLFEQLDRLNDVDSRGDELDEEIERAKAITGVADNVIKIANLSLDGQKFLGDRMNADAKLPKMLE